MTRPEGFMDMRIGFIVGSDPAREKLCKPYDPLSRNDGKGEVPARTHVQHAKQGYSTLEREFEDGFRRRDSSVIQAPCHQSVLTSVAGRICDIRGRFRLQIEQPA